MHLSALTFYHFDTKLINLFNFPGTYGLHIYLVTEVDNACSFKELYIILLSYTKQAFKELVRSGIAFA